MENLRVARVSKVLKRFQVAGFVGWVRRHKSNTDSLSSKVGDGPYRLKGFWRVWSQRIWGVWGQGSGEFKILEGVGDFLMFE